LGGFVRAFGGPFVQSGFDGFEFTSDGEGIVEDAETRDSAFLFAGRLGPDVVHAVADQLELRGGFRDLEMAAGKENSALRRTRVEEFTDIAAGIEAGFGGEGIDLRHALLFDELLVEGSGLHAGHVRANQRGDSRRHHADEDVVDLRLGTQRGQGGEGEEERFLQLQKLRLLKRQTPMARMAAPKAAVLQTGIQLSTGWLRMRWRMMTEMSDVFGRTW